MATKTKSEMIETVRKLAAVAADDSGAFKNEMGVASAKIQELMDKWAITWEEVHGAEADKQSKEFEKAFKGRSSEFKHNRIEKWHWDLARLVSRVTHTRHYSSGGRMSFFGAEDAAMAASVLYLQWYKAIREMADQAQSENWRELMKKYRGQKNPMAAAAEAEGEDPRYFRSSWIDGCLAGMSKNVKGQEKTRTAVVTSALVLYSKDVDTEYEKFSTGFRSVRANGSSGHNGKGYAKGEATGSSITIGAKPLGTSKNLPKGEK